MLPPQCSDATLQCPRSQLGCPPTLVAACTPQLLGLNPALNGIKMREILDGERLNYWNTVDFKGGKTYFSDGGWSDPQVRWWRGMRHPAWQGQHTHGVACAGVHSISSADDMSRV